MSTTTTEVTDHTIMPFGKFRGKAMINVPAIYLLWLFDNNCTHAGVKKYITANLQILKNETSNNYKK